MNAPALPRHRILVVDDNIDAAESLTLLLQLEGYTAQACTDGQQAMAALHTLGASIVLMDIGLPDVSGYELARRMRALPQGAGLLLVAVTGWGEQAAARSLQAGFDFHMCKPVDPDDLLQLLQRETRPRLRAGQGR